MRDAPTRCLMLLGEPVLGPPRCGEPFDEGGMDRLRESSDRLGLEEVGEPGAL